MFETLIKEWMDRLPDWVFTLTSLVLLILICMIASTIHKTVKRYSDAIGREDKVSNLHEELAILKDESRIHKENSQQMLSVIIHTKTFFNAIYSKSDVKEKDHFAILQRIVEALASDIKSSGLERHRCGFWIIENEDVPSESYLKLIIGSSGFPDDYINNRCLDINNSIAGRSYRKQESINIPDVKNDSDWEKSEKTSKYKALICIPINGIGVLTIDAQDEMSDYLFEISQLYGSLMEATFYQMFNHLQVEDETEEDVIDDSLQEVAATERE